MLNHHALGNNATEHTPWRSIDPEYALVASVLKKAVQDAVYKPTKRQRLENYYGHHARPDMTNEAVRWIMSEDAAPFSCEWCCDVMGLDVEVLRDAIRYRPHDVWSLVNQKQWGER